MCCGAYDTDGFERLVMPGKGLEYICKRCGNYVGDLFEARRHEAFLRHWGFCPPSASETLTNMGRDPDLYDPDSDPYYHHLEG